MGSDSTFFERCVDRLRAALKSAADSPDGGALFEVAQNGLFSLGSDGAGLGLNTERFVAVFALSSLSAAVGEPDLDDRFCFLAMGAGNGEGNHTKIIGQMAREKQEKSQDLAHCKDHEV